MDKEEIWCATLLTAYRYLPSVAKSIDKCIYATALSGMNYLGSTESLLEKMIEINIRKEAIVNAKVLTDICLNKLSESDEKVLKDKFFRGFNLQQIGREINVSRRTAYRYYGRALHNMAAAMRSTNYNADWLESKLGNDPFMAPVKRKVTSMLRNITGRELYNAGRGDIMRKVQKKECNA
ncbi:MAG: hypothetical protein K2I79_03235 [Clostridia bacterium]|nr:hypothetical protein [Clostridia bacterium]